MATYIERETYRNRLADLESWCQDLRKPGLKQALEMLDEVPAADVAPVVRCKNCRSYNKPKTGWCEVHLDREHPNDFCSYGERKDGADVVVHCKDCKHYDMGVCLKIYSDGSVHPVAWQSRRPEDFCSYGERKDRGDDRV